MTNVQNWEILDHPLYDDCPKVYLTKMEYFGKNEFLTKKNPLKNTFHGAKSRETHRCTEDKMRPRNLAQERIVQREFIIGMDSPYCIFFLHINAV